MADQRETNGQAYRQRAKEAIEQSHAAKDDVAKRTFLELAKGWFDLARRAEESKNGNK